MVYKNRIITGINKIARIFSGKNIFIKGLKDKRQVIFPGSFHPYFNGTQCQLYWIPDFQEKYYPSFFSEEDLQFRAGYQQELIARKVQLVFSSKNAADDFKKFYPAAENKTYVLPFAVTVADTSGVSYEAVAAKYGITSNHFFITPNQFWVHKNHMVIVEAAALLKNKGIKCQFVFSGLEHDLRSPHYSVRLREKVAELGLEETIIFPGFMDRKELVKLIEAATAVIQPSLFEGWSTVVEDGKAMNKYIIASNLPVHYEQMGDKGLYFDPNDAEALCSQIMDHLKSGKTSFDWQYENRRQEFGKNFMQIARSVAAS